MCTAERRYLSHILVRLKEAVLVVDFYGHIVDTVGTLFS